MNFNPVSYEGQGIRWEESENLCKIDWVPADLPLAEYLCKLHG